MKWSPGAQSQIAAIREEGGLAVFDTNGNSLFTQAHFSQPGDADSLLRLPRLGGGTDRLAWITSTPDPTYGEQYLVVVEKNVVPVVTYIGTLWAVAQECFDYDNDGDKDIFVTCQYHNLQVVFVSKESTTGEPDFGSGPSDIAFLEILPLGPCPEQHAPAACGDVDGDGDDDLILPFADSAAAVAGFYRNDVEDHLVLVPAWLPVTWNIHPGEGEIMTLALDQPDTVPAWATHLEVVAFTQYDRLSSITPDGVACELIDLGGSGGVAFRLPERRPNGSHLAFYNLLLRYAAVDLEGRVARLGPFATIWFTSLTEMARNAQWDPAIDLNAVHSVEIFMRPDPGDVGASLRGPNMGPNPFPNNGGSSARKKQPGSFADSFTVLSRFFLRFPRRRERRIQTAAAAATSRTPIAAQVIDAVVAIADRPRRRARWTPSARDGNQLTAFSMPISFPGDKGRHSKGVHPNRSRPTTITPSHAATFSRTGAGNRSAESCCEASCSRARAGGSDRKSESTFTRSSRARSRIRSGASSKAWIPAVSIVKA